MCNSCIIVAPVVRMSCGVQLPLPPSASTRLLSATRPLYVLRCMNMARRLPACLATVFGLIWPVAYRFGKHHSVCPVIACRASNWRRAKPDSVTSWGCFFFAMPLTFSLGINHVPACQSICAQRACDSSPMRHKVPRHSHTARRDLIGNGCLQSRLLDALL